MPRDRPRRTLGHPPPGLFTDGPHGVPPQQQPQLRPPPVGRRRPFIAVDGPSSHPYAEWPVRTDRAGGDV
ncbi:hypothetical protein SGPA1_12567 [Streptomyces misionensis JCM 4497]